MSVSKVILDGVTLIDLTSDTVTADALLSGVTAHALDGSTITGTITLNSAGDLSASGSIVTVPSGYYSSEESKAISAGSAYVQTGGWEINPTMSTTYLNTSGRISAIVAVDKVITPVVTPGYIATGSSGELHAYGISSIVLNIASASTYTPSTVSQTISSGVYLTGAQTIAGDTNLVAENIMAGVSIFGVVGTASGGGSYSSLSSSEIYGAAMSGWNVAEPTYGTLIWQAVASGWDVSATMSDNQIEMAVEQGWR